jgi:hypothetical protein
MTQPMRWPMNRLRFYGGGAWIIVAALAVGGTFAPLFAIRTGRDNVEVTAWGAASDAGIDFFPDFGIPVVVGAVLAVIAAVLALTSARLHPASAPVLGARLLGTGATGVVIGTTANLYLLTELFENANPGRNNSVASGLGMWLLIAASVVGIVGTVLMLVPKPGRYDPDPETPPMGIPVVRVLEPEFDPQPVDARPLDIQSADAQSVDALSFDPRPEEQKESKES